MLFKYLSVSKIKFMFFTCENPLINGWKPTKSNRRIQFQMDQVTGGQFPTLLLENIFSNNLNGSKVSINLYKFKYFYMQT